MFQFIVEWFKRLFKVTPRTTSVEATANVAYVAKYEDIQDFNITALVAGKIANIVVADSTIEVVGENARSEFLNNTLAQCTIRLKNVVNRALGTGGIILKPYIYGDKIYTDIIPQSRFIVIEQAGEVITKAGFIAEIFIKGQKTYTRTEMHTLAANGVYTIEQKADIDGTEISLASVPEWATIQPALSIGGVGRMLFSVLKCPTDNRRQFTSPFGVPITFGQEKLMFEINTLIDEMQKEFINKGVFIGIDSLLFNGNNRLPTDGIYKKFQTDSTDFWEVFSPEIRVQAYLDGINYKMGLLEKAIGVNKGVLTDMESTNATATAIRRSTFDTFALVDSMRKEIELSIDQLVYAYNVIANAANLAPQGEYELAFDWSYSLIEDSAETWAQYMGALAAGILKPERALAWLLDVDEEEALAQLPEMEQLLQAQ